MCYHPYYGCLSLGGGGGQNWKVVLCSHSSGMMGGSMRRSAAILARVQFHMRTPCPQSVSLCWSVSTFPHWLRRSVSVRWSAVRRSFVGNSSWNTVYHSDFIRSDTHAVCKVFHTRVHGTAGCFWVTLISGVSRSASAITCRVLYRRRLNTV
jgi:hypothetical protein